MKYLNYCPNDIDFSDALAMARPYLAENQIVVVSEKLVTNIELKPGETPKAIRYDSYLVRVHDDGTGTVVHIKGFN